LTLGVHRIPIELCSGVKIGKEPGGILMKVQERFGFAVKDPELFFLKALLRPDPIEQIREFAQCVVGCMLHDRRGYTLQMGLRFRKNRRGGSMWKRAAIYGALLAAGTLGLQWLDYLRLARVHSGDIYIFLIAVAFLALGIFVGVRVLGAPPPANFDGNPKARTALGISSSEMTVLEEIAAGRSNKEIAARLNISPNTVKTHVARLFEKLGAKRRTDAVKKARELGIVS
jgi:DNA-binding CsgD family transcriptional regulator